MDESVLKSAVDGNLGVGDSRPTAEGEFAGDVGQGRAARAVALGITALGHETIDHTVEGQVVVEVLARQLLDPRHRERRDLGDHLDQDAALGGVDHQQVLGVHRAPFCGRGRVELGPERLIGQGADGLGRLGGLFLSDGQDGKRGAGHCE